MTNQPAPGAGEGERWTLEFHDWGKGDEDNPDKDFKFKRSALSYYNATKYPGLPGLHLGSCVECSEAIVKLLNRGITDHAKAAAYDRAVEALEFYGVRERYLHDDNECPSICTDEGDRARAFLASLNPAASSEGN